MVLNRISEIIESPTPPSNVNTSVQSTPDKLDNAASEEPDEENNVSIVSHELQLIYVDFTNLFYFENVVF